MTRHLVIKKAVGKSVLCTHLSTVGCHSVCRSVALLKYHTHSYETFPEEEQAKPLKTSLSL